jgi:YegS/Rv2252/BmrU family lipid kinase
VRVVAIVNPVSGRRNLAGDLAEVVDRVCRAGTCVTVKVTRSAGDAARLARDAPADTRAVLVVGGDGTVREVIDGLLASGRPIPIAVMPNGTENLVAKELGLTVGPQSLARALLVGRPLSCDVGVVNRRHFLLVAGVGFDAEAVHRLAAVRKGHITHWDWFWPILRTLGTHRFPRFSVVADGEEVFDGRGMVFVGVMARYSVGLRILRRARPDDGMLDLCIVPCESRIRFLGHLANVIRQRHDRAAGVIYRKCLEIRITGDEPVPIEIDGDPGGTLPADYSVLPSAATFLGPAPAHSPAAHGARG